MGAEGGRACLSRRRRAICGGWPAWCRPVAGSAQGRTTMDALDLMLARESALKLEDPGPSERELEQIFDSAVRAPDHGRLRPWQFVVIDRDQRGRFGDLMAETLKRRDPEVSDDELQRERAKAFRAPTIVAVA